MKNFLALVLAFVLVLSLGAAAFAAGSPVVVPPHPPEGDGVTINNEGVTTVRPAPAPKVAYAVIEKAVKENSDTSVKVSAAGVADAADEFVKEQLERTDAKVLGVWIIDESAKAEGDEWVTVTVRFFNVADGTPATFTCKNNNNYTVTENVKNGVVTVRLPYGPFSISIPKG